MRRASPGGNGSPSAFFDAFPGPSQVGTRVRLSARCQRAAERRMRRATLRRSGRRTQFVPAHQPPTVSPASYGQRGNPVFHHNRGWTSFAAMRLVRRITVILQRHAPSTAYRLLMADSGAVLTMSVYLQRRAANLRRRSQRMFARPTASARNPRCPRVACIHATDPPMSSRSSCLLIEGEFGGRYAARRQCSRRCLLQRAWQSTSSSVAFANKSDGVSFAPAIMAPTAYYDVIQRQHHTDIDDAFRYGLRDVGSHRGGIRASALVARDRRRCAPVIRPGTPCIGSRDHSMRDRSSSRCGWPG